MSTLHDFGLGYKNKSGPRCDHRFHKSIRRITESTYFNGFIMCVICLNALIMAMETEDSLDVEGWRLAFDVLDYMFLTIYVVEFVLKIYAEPVQYWKSGYNIFDFTTLVTSLAQVILTWAKLGESRLDALRILRALRTLRTLRTVSFIKGLQVKTSEIKYTF